jgi:hypothetical protein
MPGHDVLQQQHSCSSEHAFELAWRLTVEVEVDDGVPVVETSEVLARDMLLLGEGVVESVEREEDVGESAEREEAVVEGVSSMAVELRPASFPATSSGRADDVHPVSSATVSTANDFMPRAYRHPSRMRREIHADLRRKRKHAQPARSAHEEDPSRATVFGSRPAPGSSRTAT